MIAEPFLAPAYHPKIELLRPPRARARLTRSVLTAGVSTRIPHEETAPLPLVAHEMRAPLSALIAASELLVEDFGVLAAEQAREMVSVIHQDALWLQGLVENLLCAGAIRAGRFHIQPRMVNLIDVVDEVQPLLMPLLRRKAQRLRLPARRSTPQVVADSRRIGQVLVNLIANASKYSGEGTTIDIALATWKNCVRLTVADRGPGIPPAGGRLFDPFYRGAEDVSSGKDGLGLGLAIVQSIIEAHGGTVAAGNRRGGGARFWFELPAQLSGSLSQVR
jgi:two-component system, OmpR family, sensor histidine kinase KdpD